MESRSVQVVRPQDRVPITDPPVPGVRREAAFAGDGGYWVGLVVTEAGLDTGWHHHGNYDTFAYVVSGSARLEYGAGGREAVEGGPGTFAHIPKGAVHREINPGAGDNAVVLVRIGDGVPVVPVDGPEPA